MILKSAGRFFTLIVRAEFGQVVNPRVNQNKARILVLISVYHLPNGLLCFSLLTCHGVSQHKHHLPTNVILGVATTLRAPGAAARATFVVVLLAVAVLVVVDLAVVGVALLVSTIGSVDGIGLPSFVCSFSTW